MRKNISIIALVAVMFIYCALTQYFNYWSLLAAPAVAIIGLALGIYIQALSDSEQTSKEKKMHNTYKKRRIVAAIIAVILLIASFVGAYKAVTYMHNVLAAPSFECKEGKVKMGDEYPTIYVIAKKFCKGNKSDAASQIMDDNGIKGKDLGSLQPGTIIVINKKGK